MLSKSMEFKNEFGNINSCARYFAKHRQIKKLLTEVNEESTVSKSLIVRQGHDARQIVFLLAIFFLKIKS